MKFLITIMFALLLWGCASSNDSAVTVDASGRHQPGWLAIHGTTYFKDTNVCIACHGSDLKGGISGVSCDKCHTLPHAKPWKGHYQATDLLTACTACHGAGLSGGAKAPACSICHKLLVPGMVPVQGECVSCHKNPPNGAVFPNRSGVHTAHTALTGVGCSVCHSGAGYGTANHGTLPTASVAFSASYYAKSGTAVRNSDGTCSNVSCHGGITTRNWSGGRLNPLTECDQCHKSGTAAGLPESNSYYSGEHTTHLTEAGLRCVDCHDMSKTSGGKSHFSGLSTPAFDLDPATTIRTTLNYSGGSCSPGSVPPPGSFSIGVCHGSRSW